MNEHDLITLNSYIDKELDPIERMLFEKRLEADPHLKGELASLKRTKLILAQAERAPLPRSFLLDKAAFHPKRGFLDTFLSVIGHQWLAAGFSMAASFIMIGSGLFLALNSPMTSARNISMAPEMAQIASEAEVMDDVAAEPMAAMEAPAEEAVPAAMPTPSPEGAVVLGMGEESSEPAENPASGMGGGLEADESPLQPMPLETASAALAPDSGGAEPDTIEDGARFTGEFDTASTAEKSPTSIIWRGILSTLLLASGGFLLILSIVVLVRISRDR